MAKLKIENIDTLILGCTHYPILRKIIQEEIGKDVTLIDSGAVASIEVENYLNGIGLRNTSNNLGQHKFYVSDTPTKFKQVANLFLGKEVEHIEKIDLEELLKSYKL